MLESYEVALHTEGPIPPSYGADWHDSARARHLQRHPSGLRGSEGPLKTSPTTLQSAAKLACSLSLVCMFRVPGTAEPSERWRKAAEAAHQGVIAKLRILSMDIVMATSDGTDRQSMQSTPLPESSLHKYAQTGWQLHCRAN